MHEIVKSFILEKTNKNRSIKFFHHNFATNEKLVNDSFVVFKIIFVLAK
jgi:hypothetical protein